MTDIDFVAITGFISGAFIGGVSCMCWERQGWIKGCLKRKLVGYDRMTGKLVFLCDRSEVP